MNDLQPLEGPQTGPDGKNFPWGPIMDTHHIGPYTIVEYQRDNSNTVSANPERLTAEHGQHFFHVYINGRDHSRSYQSLDQALVGAVAHNAEGPNSQAAAYFFRMVGI